MSWLATDTLESGRERDWLVLADDADNGGIHLVDVADGESGPVLTFHPTQLTPPPPEIAGFPIDPGSGYDWEAIAFHPWSNTVFLANEGSVNEIAIYHGKATPGERRARSGAAGPAGPVSILPGHICNFRPLRLPRWDEVFGSAFADNLGIEGLACTRDRLFVGLESPCQFFERLTEERSTILAIWRIDADDPSDMEACELLAVHDTADWAPSIGYTIETICGLDAIDDNHIVGVDRDNTCLFSVVFDDSGGFVSGRILFLDTPGPEPFESDDCPPLEGPPRLFKPTLESVAVVPCMLGEDSEEQGYRIYLAVDPWAPGWTLVDQDWDCPAYVNRLSSLLPALYRYTVPASALFPE
jgi:hypothetical protein